MGLRDRLRNRIARVFKAAATAVTPSPPTTPQPPPQPPPAAPAKPVKPAPPSPPPPAPELSPEDSNLLGQLSTLTLHTAEIVTRLEELGLGAEAKVIVGTKPVATGEQAEADVAKEIEEITTASLDLTNVAAQAAAEAAAAALEAAKIAEEAARICKEKGLFDMAAKALAAAKKAQEAAKAASDTADTIATKGEEALKKIRGTPRILKHPITIGFLSLPDSYRAVKKAWDDLGFGLKRTPGKPRPDGTKERGTPIGEHRFAPMAVAVGGPLDKGANLPPWALINEAAFHDWAVANGYDEGLSVIIQGAIPRSGEILIRTR